MKAGSRGVTSSRERFGLRRLLVVSQVAMSLVLLFGALLFVRTLRNLMTVVVTMRIVETYKGPARKTITFRQYVWSLDESQGATEYGKGQELLLLLRPVSEYGLTSPVGLGQGRFLISTDRKGHVTAVNSRGNVGLFNSVAQRAQAHGLQLSPRVLTVAQQHRGGPIPLTDLQEAIRTFVGTR